MEFCHLLLPAKQLYKIIVLLFHNFPPNEVWLLSLLLHWSNSSKSDKRLKNCQNELLTFSLILLDNMQYLTLHNSVTPETPRLQNFQDLCVLLIWINSIEDIGIAIRVCASGPENLVNGWVLIGRVKYRLNTRYKIKFEFQINRLLYGTYLC